MREPDKVQMCKKEPIGNVNHGQSKPCTRIKHASGKCLNACPSPNSISFPILGSG